MGTGWVLLATSAATATLMILVWLLSLAKRDVSIVDIFWGLGFVLIAHVACRIGGGYSGRKLLVTSLVTVWGVRLAVYLLWRNWGHEEDYRYRAMRKHHGERFAVGEPLHRLRVAGRVDVGDLAAAAGGAAVAVAGTADVARCARGAGVGRRPALRIRRRLAAGALQGRSGEPRQGDEPRPLGVHAAPQLLRRRGRVVGVLPHRAGHAVRRLHRRQPAAR